MVALSKEWTLGAWLASPASAPYGFKTLTGAAVALGPDLELSAQALPFAAALLGIAATGLLTFRLTRSAPATWVAAAIVAGDVVLHTQMARVKPYATDLLVVTAVGLCFQSLWEGYSRRRLWTFVVTAVVGLLLSSLALFTVASAATMTAWTAWRRGLRDPQLFAAAAVLVISVGALALATLTTSGFEQL